MKNAASDRWRRNATAAPAISCRRRNCTKRWTISCWQPIIMNARDRTSRRRSCSDARSRWTRSESTWKGIAPRSGKTARRRRGWARCISIPIVSTKPSRFSRGWPMSRNIARALCAAWENASWRKICMKWRSTALPRHWEAPPSRPGKPSICFICWGKRTNEPVTTPKRRIFMAKCLPSIITIRTFKLG
ncbi:MAG: hypothetical protein BWZ10_02244 [candidate division BRC1 bacterium ADurb.BinA364]|nr:MAG: hypothetical protein BWZ10_02244 [candidate division BRC1 bacterium ADurb.BinA364]